MNIHIHDKVAYYLPFLFKIEDIKPEEREYYLNKIRFSSIKKIVSHWKTLLKQEFRLDIAISLALFFAIKADEENCNEYLWQIKQKHKFIRSMEIIKCILFCETTRFDEAMHIIKNFPLDIANLPFIIRIKADILFAMEDYSKSESLYNSILNKATMQSSIYSRLGEINLINNKIEIANKYLNKAIKIDKNNVMAHFYLGDIYKMNGDVEKAKMEYGICAGVDFKNDFAKMAQQKLLLLCCDKSAV